MSNIKDKTSGASYIGKPIADIKSALESSPNNRVEGILFESSSLDKIPSRAKQGDLSKFLDLKLVETESIFRDFDRGTMYIGS